MDYFKDTRTFNNYLSEKEMIKREKIGDKNIWVSKDQNSATPNQENSKFFLALDYHGKKNYVRFNPSSINWIE
ncbi:hypothetical protein [Neisseria iguanae]|uniref:hypothetical protein n=1 Tax=Neisseria iguanae TaxID=90242 RepID=UPI0014757CEA|nr:hypothetical protein [Neisseria iguanae]